MEVLIDIATTRLHSEEIERASWIYGLLICKDALHGLVPPQHSHSR